MENMVIDGVSARMIMAGTSGDRWEDVASDIVRKKKKKKKEGQMENWESGMDGCEKSRLVLLSKRAASEGDCCSVCDVSRVKVRCEKR